MKLTSSTVLLASILIATATATPLTSANYKLRIESENPWIQGSTLVVKDESAANTFPNPLGSFSTGEPRHPYTFTISTFSETDKLYELKGTVRQTHLILNGDPRAPQLFDVPIGGDPVATSEKTTRTKFLIRNEGSKMYLNSAENTRGYDGDFEGPGTWRACTGGTRDYQLYWFDGLSNLTAIVDGCERVHLVLDVAEPSESSTIVPTPTTITSGWITGVPAPTGNPTVTELTPSSTTIPQITIRIFNDQTGANAEATVFADGTPRSISDLFHNTAIDGKDGIIGTTAQLVKFSDTTKCSLVNLNVRDWVIDLDGRAKNFVDLDGDFSKPIQLWLGGFTFQCSQA